MAALTTHYRASRDSERAEPAAPVFVPPAVQPGTGQAHDAAPPAAVTPTPRPNETLYRVQVGVFSEKRNAERLVELLKEEGYDALVISEAAYHRVQTGGRSVPRPTRRSWCRNSKRRVLKRSSSANLPFFCPVDRSCLFCYCRCDIVKRGEV